MNLKPYTHVIYAAAALFALSSCGTEGDGRRFLSVGTAPPGGAFFVGMSQFLACFSQ